VLVKCWGWDRNEIMLQNSTGYLVYEALKGVGLFVDIGNMGVYWGTGRTKILFALPDIKAANGDNTGVEQMQFLHTLTQLINTVSRGVERTSNTTCFW
jgi:hypothetical protein